MQIQNFIFRSVIEDKALASIFLVNIKKEFITQDFQVVYEEIQKAYNEDMPFSVLYFSRVIPENLMLQILMHTPSKDIQPFFRFLKQDYVIRMQTQISDKLLECSKNNRIADFQSLLNEFDYNSDKEYRTMKQWYDYFQSNNINIKKFELGIPFLDVALHGGIELGQLILVSGEYEAGKTSLCLQIIENLSKYHKTCLFSFEFPVDTYILKKIPKLDKQVMQGVLSSQHKDNIIQNMIIVDHGMNVSDVSNAIVFLANQGVKFFVIDSQMRLNAEQARNTEEEESAKFDTLAQICHKYKVVIFLIVQTSKNDVTSPLGSKKGGHYSNIMIRIERVKSKDNKSEFSENERNVIIQKNKQTGIHGKFLVDFDTQNLTFSSNEVVEYKEYTQNQKTEAKNKLDDAQCFPIF